MDFSTFKSKINWKQGKFRLPLIIYPLLLLVGYTVISLFHTTPTETPTHLETTAGLNPSLPEASLPKDIGDRRSAMEKEYHGISDLTAVEGVEREYQTGPDYESQYDKAEASALDSLAMRRQEDDLEKMLAELDAQAKAEAAKANTTPIPEVQTPEDAKNEALAELQRLLNAQFADTLHSGDSDTATTGISAPTLVDSAKVSGKAVIAPSANDETTTAVKKPAERSDYFYTLSENEPESNLIKAIIDEDIKAVEGSRVRLRLLDDVELGGNFVRKGSYVYAIMSGFGSQRVQGKISTMLVGDNIVKVNLNIYDLDGIEGLYVPQSSFRETAKDVAGGAMGNSMTINNGGYENSMAQWGMQAVQNAISRSSQAISSAIKKNKVKLKYGTQVYLVNGQIR